MSASVPPGELQASFRGATEHRLQELRDLTSLDPAMQELFRQIRKSAVFPDFPGAKLANIHIRADRGPGREIVARHAHRLSPRAGGPFVAFDCAALEEGERNIQLFGQRRAGPSDVPGALVSARGGTVFIDNLEDLSTGAQSYLCFAFETGLRRLGSTDLTQLDARLITATAPDVSERVGYEAFHPSLYYFISVLHLDIPPLRGRP